MRWLYAIGLGIWVVGLGAHTLQAAVVDGVEAIAVTDRAVDTHSPAQMPSMADRLAAAGVAVTWTSEECSSTAVDAGWRHQSVVLPAQAPTPARQPLHGALRALVVEKDDAQEALLITRKRHALAVEQVGELQRDVTLRGRTLERERAAYNQLSVRLGRAVAAAEDIRAHSRRRSPSDAVRSLAAQEAGLRAAYADQGKALQVAMAHHQDGVQALHTARQNLQQLESRQQEQEALLVDLIEREEQLQQTLRAADGSLAGGASGHAEKEWTTVSIPMQHVTRRCTVSAVVSWADGTTTPLHAFAEDSDTTHMGDGQAGVDPDTLDFHRSDAQRVDAAKHSLQAQLVDGHLMALKNAHHAEAG